MDFTQIINTLGFPVACVIGLSMYFVQKDKANREDTNKMIENMRSDAKEDRNMYQNTINKFDDKLDKFSIALENYNGELRAIKEELRSLREGAK